MPKPMHGPCHLGSSPGMRGYGCGIVRRWVAYGELNAPTRCLLASNLVQFWIPLRPPAKRDTLAPESWLDSRRAARQGGKSGLHRAERQVTPGRREPTESAAESRPPMAPQGDQVRVKGCGKSAPRDWQQFVARQTPLGARPNRNPSVWPALGSGRLLEAISDDCRRGMAVLDRTRLTGQLSFFNSLPRCHLSLVFQKNINPQTSL